MPGFIRRFFAPPTPPLGDLWRTITETARQPRWYTDYAVADTVDGRFDMVSMVTAFVMLSLEQRDRVLETSILTERFVEDMDGSLRDIGIGDMVVGKHMGRMMGALGGRLEAYRDALAEGAEPDAFAAALARNMFRDPAALELGRALAVPARALYADIGALSDADLLAGKW